MSSRIKHLTLHIFLLAVLLSSCSPRAVREAQEVVAHADSLREAHLYAQNEYDDSLSLAQAYETLKKIPLPFRGWLGLNSSYAHACYHYGRLLRTKDNHVEAMKVFIAATHSRTRDYRILGRIYNNMGDMAHLAGDYALSYDMFAISADCFLQNGDTINYYYGLNDMAFRLAEQGKKEETLVLLDSITRNCDDKNVILKTWETKAEMYREISQYDSAIYCANQMQLSDWIGLTGIMIKAQSFYRLNEKDSALLYANLILNNPYSSYQNRFNALYIVTNGDSTLSKERIREYASQREDIRYYEHEPKQNQLSQATQLLEQDLTREPDLRWLYSTIGTIVLIGVGIFFYVRKKHHKRELLSQQIEELENRNNNTIAQISAQIENNIALLSQSANLKEDLSWSDYNKLCRIVDLQFNLLATKLHKKQVLNETQIRLCVLVLLNLRRVDIANTLPYAQNGIGKLKDQTSKLLGTTGKNLRLFLIKVAIEE